VSRQRVLHTVGNLELGGGQKLVALVAGALDPERFEVAVLSFGPPGPYGERLRAQGVQVIDLGLVRPLRTNRPSTILDAAAMLIRTVVFGRWDIVHTHMFLSSVVVTPLARLGGARAMGTTHRIYYGRLQPWIERLVAVLQERIVVDSNAVGEILRSRTHIPERKYVVIYNGIDVEEFRDPPSQDAARSTLGISADAVVVGEVAHLMPHKGQRHLIDALAPVLRERADVRLLLVGDGADRLALERQVEAQGVSPHVIFTGPRSDLASVLSAIDVLALPSTFEGFGIVQAEAMYLERPVVATNHGGSTEVVSDGDTGFLVPFGDVKQLRARLAELIDDPQLRLRMGASGRARVLDRFTAERMAGSYAALYRS
jgi:glycosyltransferase involved in cell wall biosynthesis